MKTLFVCGGTGGHIYPAISLAREFQVQGSEIIFLGRTKGMEGQIIPDHFDFISVEAHPLVRGSLVANLKLPLRLVVSIWQAYKKVKESGADYVVGTGGFVTLPVILASFMAGKKIYLQEQNAVAGIANKIGSWFASKVFVASQRAVKEFPKGNSYNLGNPVRVLPNSKDIMKPELYHDFKKVIMVIGGSQGAEGVNKKISSFASSLPADTLLFWQVGLKHSEKYQKEFGHLTNVKVVGYVNDIYAHMYHSNVLISRAGASTLAEITCLGKASILIPYPYATANHQEANARELEKAGAALVELESEKNEIWAKATVILKDKNKLNQMEKASKNLGKPEAAKDIVMNILGVNK